MTNQSGVQQAVRDITGTALDYNGDWSALFDQDGIPAGDWNGRLLAWINQTLGTSYTNLPGAMQAFAVEQGFRNWSSMNTFSVESFHPTDLTGLVALYDISDLTSLKVERTGASASTPASVGGVVGTVLDLSGKGRHLIAASDAARSVLRSGAGLYRLESDGVDDAYSASVDFDLSATALGCVTQQTGSAATGIAFGVENTANRRFQFGADSTGPNRVGINTTVGSAFPFYALGSAQQKTVSYQSWNGSTIRAYTNGALANSGSISGTITTSGGVIYLGASPSFASLKFTGSFYAGALFSRALEAEEQQQLEQWLAARGGVTL